MTSIFHPPYRKPFLRHPIEGVKCFLVGLKWAFQRARKGYCDWDLSYGVENWLLEMLPDAIDEIRRESTRVPMVLYDEVIASKGLDPYEYGDLSRDDSGEPSYGQIEAEAKEKWDAILSRISFLLRETVDWKCSRQNPYETQLCEARSDDPDYEALQARYYKEEDKLDAYREACKKEAIWLLVKWSGYLEI